MHFLHRFLKRLPISKEAKESVLQIESAVARRWVAATHRDLMAIQWSIPPQPEHFDHHIDLYYHWLASRNPLWLERGVYGSLALQGGRVLEMACGDGFNARNFYSLRSQWVVACDFDPKAIAVAKQKNSAPNITYLIADIRAALPEGSFENVVWDGAIEHFTLDEIGKILDKVKKRLTGTGVLSGYTIVEKADGKKSLSHHEYEFKSKQDLLQTLAPHFQHVTVFETVYPDRHNLYFWASDGEIPFGPSWSASISHRF